MAQPCRHLWFLCWRESCISRYIPACISQLLPVGEFQPSRKERFERLATC